MSDQPDNIDLAYIGRALNRLTSEVAALRDDMSVLTAMTMRLDGSHTALLTELRAIHAQQSHMANRVRALEEHQPGAVPGR
jgi:hypothetical protein